MTEPALPHHHQSGMLQKSHLSVRLIFDCRTNWEACSTCEVDSDPEWTCPAAAAVYNDLLGASPGTAANIVEVEGGAGKRQGQYPHSLQLQVGTQIGAHVAVFNTEQEYTSRDDAGFSGLVRDLPPVFDLKRATRQAMFECLFTTTVWRRSTVTITVRPLACIYVRIFQFESFYCSTKRYCLGGKLIGVHSHACPW